MDIQTPLIVSMLYDGVFLSKRFPGFLPLVAPV